MDIDFEAYIREHFTYMPDGTLVRDDRKNSGGSYDKDGYLIIKVKTKQFKAHRIVWFLNYGKFPDGELDHINRCRTDNRVENLRECDRKTQVNNRTYLPNKDTGVVGVYIDRTRGLKAKYAFTHEGKTYRYRTLKEAVEKRQCLKNL